jgi:hypothetical protein
MWPIAIVGHLKPGWEDADAIAARLGRVFESLAEVDPMFSRWRRVGVRRHRSAVPLLITMPPEQAELRCWIDESAIFGSREGRKKAVGYSIRALTTEQNPVCVDFQLSFIPEDWWFGHRIGITILTDARSPSVLDNPTKQGALIELVRRVLLIAATAWDCDWAGVMPGNYRQHGGSPGSTLVKYQSGWMVYLDAARAAHILPPEDVTVEKLPDGATLLTAATDAVFDGKNPNHMAAAFRIQDAVAPLNNLANERPSS